MTKEKAKKTTYEAEDIKELPFPDNVRHRSTMYVGSTGIAGNTHLLREGRDNSIDEAINGHGNTIVIEVSNKKGSATIIDEGRGIPPEAIETVFTKLHSSGKFEQGNYTVSGGLNGVGSSCINALSKRLIVEVKRKGFLYTMEFSKGHTVKKLTKKEIS